MQNPVAGLRRWLAPVARSRAAAVVRSRLRSGLPGQGMVEYSLILMLVAIAVIVIFVVVGHRVSDLYSNVNNGLGRASG